MLLLSGSTASPPEPGSLILCWPAADFFTSCINLSLPVAVAIMFFAYLLSFMSWGFAWWLLYE